MSLEQLCREIEHRAATKSASVVRDAHEDAQKTVREAKAMADKTVREARQEAEKFASSEGAERLANAQIEAQKIRSDAKEEAVRANRQRVWERYAAQTRKSAYARKLKKWAQEALDELGANGVLRTNAQDRSLLSSSGMRVSSEPLECAGGVRAETADGRIGVDFTLEAQFEARKEEIEREIYARLFAQEEDVEVGASLGARTGAKRRARAPKSRRAALGRKSGRAKPGRKTKARGSKR
ncbi:MAG: V-type ATP synthase subunit E [Candidatus Micrarchaeota archaeon]